MSKIDENYWTERFMVENFYRKGALENNKFTYLAEAIIQYYNRGYHKTDKTSLDINILDVLKKTKAGTATMELSVYNGENIYIINLKNLMIYVGFDNDRIYRVDTKGGENETGTSFQYRAYKGKLYPFYFRIKKFSKDGNRISGHMITEYKGRDVRGEAAIEAKLAIGEEISDRPNLTYYKQLEMIEKRTKVILVEKSKKILEETDMDLIYSRVCRY